MPSAPHRSPPPPAPSPPPLYTPVISSTADHLHSASKRVAVAICGQLGRLELKSKIKNLAEANRRKNVAVAMFLVVQERTFAFGGSVGGYRMADDAQNKGVALYDTAFEKLPALYCGFRVVRHISSAKRCHKKVRVRCMNGMMTMTGSSTCNMVFSCGNPARDVQCNESKSRASGCVCDPAVYAEFRRNYPDRNCTGHTYSKETAVAELQRNGIPFSANFPKHSRWAFLPDEVKKLLLRHPHVSKPKSISSALIEGVMNMRKAALMIEQYEVQHGFLFDHVMRIRDDSIVTMPYIYPFTGTRAGFASFFGNASRTRPCLAKNCFGWHGINDKAMLCPRAHMHAMLRAFGEDMMFTKGEGLWDDWFSEKALERTMGRYGDDFLAIVKPR
ncbi:MAG: hypothetical protein SGPRY_007281 [Prymnesium sp.]